MVYYFVKKAKFVATEQMLAADKPEPIKKKKKLFGIF